jgi:hypothetical protein
MWPFQKKRPDLPALQKQLVELAEQVARENFGITLDYSVGSVRQVELILGKLHEDYLKSKSQDGLRGLALAFASYLIAVIEKNFQKGKLTRDHPQMGPNTFPYEWNGATLFPYGWCMKRLVDGPEDDVWAKFQALVVAETPAG